MDPIEAEVERVALEWLARIAELPGRHVAIEALWDGDTHGWFLRITLVTHSDESPAWGYVTSEDGHFARPLGMLRYGGDIRLFNGQVPPWPEAIVARRAGARVADALGLKLWFPSPNEPRDDERHWWEAIH
jgi:hypothetical protein